jgi:hypothetical protein
VNAIPGITSTTATPSRGSVSGPSRSSEDVPGARVWDVWVEGSRRYADPQRYLIPNERWPSPRGEVRLQTGTFLEGTEQLAKRKRELRRRSPHQKVPAFAGPSRDPRRLNVQFSRNGTVTPR